MSIAVVVSPLNALMYDQVTRFCSLGMIRLGQNVRLRLLRE